MTPQPTKCSKPCCNEPAVFRTGVLTNARAWCIKHYAERMRKQTNDVKGSENWSSNG